MVDGRCTYFSHPMAAGNKCGRSGGGELAAVDEAGGTERTDTGVCEWLWQATNVGQALVTGVRIQGQATYVG